tara:strand:+ start:1855 stop:2187 length:333 start_codon:yes stop_codon:yes gene_type:complete
MSGHHPNPADQYYNYQPQPVEVMPDTELMLTLIERIGVPVATLIAAGYLIMWLLKNATKEREQWQQRDEQNDERIMKLVESSSDALLHVKIALEQNTQAMKEYIRFRGGQ